MLDTMMVAMADHRSSRQKLVAVVILVPINEPTTLRSTFLTSRNKESEVRAHS